MMNAEIADRQPPLENSSRHILKMLHPAADKPQVPSEEKIAAVSVSGDANSSVLEIQDSEITWGEKIGIGSTSTIHAGKWNGMPVAVKKMAFTADSTKKLFDQEVALLSVLKHDGIVKMHGVIREPVYSIVFEWLPIDLFDYIDSKASIDYISIAYDIAAALSYLHENNINHRDIKAENTLIDSYGHAIICDFGVAKKIDAAGEENPWEEVGTVGYLAPETISGGVGYGKYFTEKSDIFSLGILMWETVARVSYMSHLCDHPYLLNENVKKGNREPIPKDCDADFAKLINQCCEQDPQLRPTAETVAATLLNKLRLRVPNVVDTTKTSEPDDSVLSVVPRGP